VNLAASSKRPRKRDKRKPSLVKLDEGHGSCEELGTAAKNPPAYREQHGMKEDAVNWEDPPPHGFFLGIRKETF
jgi:hypothetical protein